MKALLAAAGFSAIFALAACGGGSSGAAPTTTQHVPVAHKTMQASARFSVASVSGLGKVLVDGKGMTVYVLTKDGHTNLPCTDESGCTDAWPDLPFTGNATAAKAGPGLTASLLGAKKLSDGETYPTYNGWLMYEYAGDSGPRQANGEELESFGGKWYALSPSGAPVKTSSSDDSGYSY